VKSVNYIIIRAILVAATVVVFFSAIIARAEHPVLVFAGSGHTNIQSFWLDESSGALTPTGESAFLKAPSFLAITPNRKFLYAISEEAKAPDCFVSAFRIDAKTGKLTILNHQLTRGTGPCHVDVDPKGEDVLVANYISGSTSVFPIERDGALGSVSAFEQDQGSSINHSRQEGPHAHCVVTDRDDRFAFVCDLGIDKVMAFKFDPAHGTLTPNNPPSTSIKPGSGPRHIAFHPNRRNVYVVSELTSTLTAFAYDRHRGVMTQLEEHPLLPADFHGESYAAEVAVHPSGKFVYASTRFYDSIVVFRCDESTGRLTFVERDSSGGKTPRHFEIDPSGRFMLVANQDSNTIVVLSIDSKTGQLQPTGNEAASDKPMCVKCLGSR
jgi:6-phosphogluconolactonase